MNQEFKKVVLNGQELDNYFIDKTGNIKNIKGLVLKHSRPGAVLLSIKGKRKHAKISDLIINTFGGAESTETDEPVKEKELSQEKNQYFSSNKSYLNMSEILDKVGVNNCYAHCKVVDPRVVGLNPFSKNLTEEEKNIIIEECSNNIFYFIGECLRLPDDFGLSRFELNIANLSAIWAFNNGISTYSALPSYPGRKFSQFAIATWLILFRDLSVSYVSKIDITQYCNKIIGIVDALPDFIKDINKVKSADLRLINNQITNSYKNDQVVLIDELESIPGSDKIIPTNKDTLVSINTLVGDPEDIGYNPLSIISRLPRWSIEFFDLTTDEIESLKGKMVYIEYPIKDLVRNVDKYCADFVRRSNYDQNLTDRVLFMRRKQQVDQRLDDIMNAASKLDAANKILHTYKPGGYIHNVIDRSLETFKSKGIDLDPDMIKLATIYSIIKDVNLEDDFDIDLTANYGSFEEFAIKTFGIIDEDTINELINMSNSRTNKIINASYALTGEVAVRLYPDIRRLYDEIVDMQGAYQRPIN